MYKKKKKGLKNIYRSVRIVKLVPFASALTTSRLREVTWENNFPYVPPQRINITWPYEKEPKVNKISYQVIRRKEAAIECYNNHCLFANIEVKSCNEIKSRHKDIKQASL